MENQRKIEFRKRNFIIKTPKLSPSKQVVKRKLRIQIKYDFFFILTCLIFINFPLLRRNISIWKGDSTSIHFVANGWGCQYLKFRLTIIKLCFHYWSREIKKVVKKMAEDGGEGGFMFKCICYHSCENVSDLQCSEWKMHLWNFPCPWPLWNRFKKDLLGKSQFKQKYIMFLSLSNITYANN